jgi:hypothetical protein
VAEWSKASVLKTDVVQATASSNLALSANDNCERFPCFAILSLRTRQDISFGSNALKRGLPYNAARKYTTAISSQALKAPQVRGLRRFLGRVDKTWASQAGVGGGILRSVHALDMFLSFIHHRNKKSAHIKISIASKRVRSPSSRNE